MQSEMLNMTLVLKLDFLNPKLKIDMDGCYPYSKGVGYLFKHFHTKWGGY